MFCESGLRIVGNAEGEVLGIEAFQDVDEFHRIPPSQRREIEYRSDGGRLRPRSACRGPPTPFGLRRGSLRYLRYESFLGFERKLAKRAKAGGARRDRTADLLHAMQALSQLSYGPLTLSTPWATRRQNPEHSSGLISSLLVAADVADDVGHVLVAFFLVGDEGGIVIVVVFDGFVDLDVVFRFGNRGLDLAGVFLGVGFLERHQFFGLSRLRRGFGGSGGGRGSRARGGVGAGSRRRHRRNRHAIPGVGRNHRTLVKVVKLLTRGRANTFGSEIGFGHV